MKSTQLSLIEELSLDRIKDSIPTTPTSKFIPPSSVPHALALFALRSGPQPLERLQRIADANDGATLLADLRKLGVELVCHEVPEVVAGNAEGRTCTVCMLTAGAVRRIDRWLKAKGGKHV